LKRNQLRSWIQEEAVKAQEVGIPRASFIEESMKKMVESG